jgi:pyrroloquinoline quinone biosynthesis protein D
MTDVGSARPRLARRARLRPDPRSDRLLLLYPERGLVLNDTAADVVRLCTGEHTVAAIITTLAEKYRPAPASVVAREVTEFLALLAGRGLVAWDA